MKNIGLITSGGDAPGMNAAIRAVVRMGIYCGMNVYGFTHGYQGILDQSFLKMDRGSVADIIQRGGTVLQTARCEDFFSFSGREKAANNLKELEIEGLIVIGGDGSFRGADLIAQEQNVNVICIPATIDNDIGGTDYCIGFDTAVNTVVDAINKIRDTATSHERIFIVEVMGRTRGFLTLYAGLAAGAESIIIPEVALDLKKIYQKLEHGSLRGKKYSIIMLAEGVKGIMSQQENAYHSPAYALSKLITQNTGNETRVIVLGHLQRGGAPTARDRILASRMAFHAVELLTKGASGLMVGIVNEETSAESLQVALAKEPIIDEEMLHLAHVLSL